MFLANIVPLVNRVCILDFNNFQAILTEFLNEQNITFEHFLAIWMNKMENMISIEAR